MDAWQELNERQQTYLRAIFEQDQAQERSERLRAAREQHTRPADQWRWILYANTEHGHTPLKQAIKDAGLVDPGTGSTFKALEERGYILVVSEGATSHRRSELIVTIRLTTKGRRLVRSALSLTSTVRLPVGTLREWHWRALVHAYKAGEQGAGEWPRDIGHMTVRRLEEYRVKGQDHPLIGYVEIPCEPYVRKRWPGDSGYTTTTRDVLRITAFGLQYYRENWQRYRDLYPTVNAPIPDDHRSQEQQEPIGEQDDQISSLSEGLPFFEEAKREVFPPKHAGGRPAKGRVRVNIKLTAELQKRTEALDRSQLIIDLLNAHFGIRD